MKGPRGASQRIASRAASPVVRHLFAEMQRQGATIEATAHKLGMSYVGLAYWKMGRHSPSIVSIEALANVLGYELALQPLDKQE